MIERTLAGLALLLVALLAAYWLGRAHGGDAELARWEARSAKVLERTRTAVAATDETTRQLELEVLPELAAHTERAHARAQEADRAISDAPHLDALRLPDALRRLRDAQLTESRRAAEAAGSGR
ncbi:hypothetical protein BGP89_11415 [Luteimonas sp. JM171]|uniref:hypothetical protein n=1 Tax=Luteimonas sp. JM171 TaxID=1896164 RepID=UPI0008570AE4|nr:hypothetical protein [Luteimonas sp. JM171]AOH36887.1 hypothetical protein BGP89_11415 [Luteimonas sp. JM171]